MKKQIISIAVIFLSITLLLSACAAEPEIVKNEPQNTSENNESQPASNDPSTKETPAEQKAEEQADATTDQNAAKDDASANEDFVGPLEEIKSETEGGPSKIKAADFSLVDQNSVRHKLEDYQGKVIILNFWQTWCPPCKAEMPDFQKYYDEHGQNQEEIVLLGVSSPKNPLQIYRDESMSDNEIANFLKEAGYSYPSLMDYKGALFATYQVNSFPSTFFIDKEGFIVGKAPGKLSYEQLTKIVDDILAE